MCLVANINRGQWIQFIVSKVQSTDEIKYKMNALHFSLFTVFFILTPSLWLDALFGVAFNFQFSLSSTKNDKAYYGKS